MLARAIEEAGLPTAAVALIKEHAERVKPPRALFVPFPFGFALGNPNDPAFQHKVLGALLGLFESESSPTLAEFPEDAEAPVRLLQASAARGRRRLSCDAGAGGRDHGGPWATMSDGSPSTAGRTMVGLCGVPQRRWRGLMKFLEAYAGGSDEEYDEKPADMPLARFIRVAADDIKAFYMEARMCQRPGERDNDLQRWFWAETAAGGHACQGRRTPGGLGRRVGVALRARRCSLASGSDQLGDCLQLGRYIVQHVVVFDACLRVIGAHIPFHSS